MLEDLQGGKWMVFDVDLFLHDLDKSATFDMKLQELLGKDSLAPNTQLCHGC